MATHRIAIISWNTSINGAANVLVEPYDVRATNDVWKNYVLSFKDSATRDLIYGAFDVPQNYVGSAVFRVVWTSATITGDVVWDLDYRAVGGDDAESLDQAGTQEALTVTDVAPSAAHERNTPTMTATAAFFAAGDTVTFLFGRDGAAAGDTMAGIAHVFGLYFEYADA